MASTGQLKNVFAFDLNGDSDGDGWSDIYELSHPYTGTNPLGVNPSPFNADTDGDGIPDGQETGSSAWLADTDGDGFKDGEDRWPQDGRRGDYIPPKFYAVTDLSAYLPDGHPAKNLEPEHITIDDEHNVSWVARNPDKVVTEDTDTIPQEGGDGVRTQKVAGPTHHVVHWKAADGTISSETLVDREDSVFTISGGLQTTAIDTLSRTIAGVTTGTAGPKGVYGSFQADLFTKYHSTVDYFHGARVLRGLTAEGTDGLAVPEALSPYDAAYLNSMTETVDRALYYPTADKPAWDHIGDDLLDDGYTLGTNVEANSRKGNVAGTISYVTSPSNGGRQQHWRAFRNSTTNWLPESLRHDDLKPQFSAMSDNGAVVVGYKGTQRQIVDGEEVDVPVDIPRHILWFPNPASPTSPDLTADIGADLDAIAVNDQRQIVATSRTETDDYGYPKAFFVEVSATGTVTIRMPLVELLKWDNKPEGVRDDYDRYFGRPVSAATPDAKAQIRKLVPQLMTNADPQTVGFSINGMTFTNGAPAHLFLSADEVSDSVNGDSWVSGLFSMPIVDGQCYALTRREPLLRGESGNEPQLGEPRAIDRDGNAATHERIVNGHKWIEYEAFFERDDAYHGFDPPMHGDPPGAPGAGQDQTNPKWYAVIGYPTAKALAVPAADIVAAGASPVATLVTSNNVAFRYKPRDNAPAIFNASWRTGSLSNPGDKPAGGTVAATVKTDGAFPNIKMVGLNLAINGASGPSEGDFSLRGEAEVLIKALSGSPVAPLPNPTAILKVDVMPVRYVPIGLWYLEDGNQNTDDVPAAKYILAFKVLERLNKVFRQACVQFIPANKDADGSAVFLPVPRPNNQPLIFGHEKKGAGPLRELNLMALGEMVGLHGDKLPLPGAKIHLIVVKRAGPSTKGSPQPFGISWSLDGVRDRCFMNAQGFEDIQRGANPKSWMGEEVIYDDYLTICAHEVGHVLGLSTRNANAADPIAAQHDQGLAPWHLYNIDGTPVPDEKKFLPPAWFRTFDRLPWSNIPGPVFGKRRIEIGLMYQAVGAPGALEDAGFNVQLTFPGSGNRSWWIRHEDWREANFKARLLELE